MLHKVIEVSKIAGEIIRQGFGKNFSIELKGSLTNLVTEIDKKSEAAIIGFIKKEFPGHAVLAEESGSHKTDSEYLWVIDPLDGTTNFAHGLPIFSVSIGIMKKGETICGVVYDVMNDAVFSAEKGSGAFSNGKRLAVSLNDDLRKSVLVTGFPYNISENPDQAIERFEVFLKEARAIRRLGSAALDLCYVAAGIFDGFWEVQLHPWDMCAGNLLVEEAGGSVTDFSNRPIDLSSVQILATNGKVHQSMMQMLKV
jgi:myo-inositol-1(or 4)-monophosphatase